MLLRVLLALDPPELQRRVDALLDRRVAVTVPGSDAADLWSSLKQHDIDVIVVSVRLAPDPIEPWIGFLRTLPDPPEAILVWDRENAARRASLLAAGALAVLNERVDDHELRETLRTLLARARREGDQRLTAQRVRPPTELGDFVSESPAMRRVLAMARRIASSEASVLLLGETGVGKERLARAIHAGSARSAGPFIPVNCGAIPETLLESELFGHEQGAFTGATRARRGLFEQAHGGTLFLDEIGELPLHLQVKLLRALESRHVQRLGSEGLTPVDVRIVTATNRDLEKDVRAGRFRSDLFFRLAVVTLLIPPLRDRREDVPALAEAFVAELGRTLRKPWLRLSPEAARVLERYAWPGNVRELVNVIERAVLLADGPEITTGELPANLLAEGTPGGPDAGAGPGEIRIADERELVRRPLQEVRTEVVTALETTYLRALLTETRGRVGEAAERAGLNPRTLFELMRRHGLRKEDFKPGYGRTGSGRGGSAP